MKVCPNCQTTHDDSMAFCLQCGTALVDAPAPEAQAAPAYAAPAPEAQAAPAYAAPAQPYNQAAYAQPAAQADPDNHTAEFDSEDIAENKIFAIAAYLFGAIGIIIAVLCAKDSAFVKFHIKQVLRLSVVMLLTAIITSALCWTIIVGIAGGVFMCIISVIYIIGFVQACKGEAKDLAIIKKFKFLK
ncbi:MAG: DUF4870 domain-containing protein [Ruminococcaceae bacterium]|nr:DUF4870 domain-containing protein [Oscillospiraceae bacterium]